MPKGDVFSAGPTSLVAATGVLDIRPGAGIEAVVHNIRWNVNVGSAIDVRLAWKDATNSFEFDSDTVKGGRLALVDHVTNDRWIQVQNKHATASLWVSYDGILTK